MIQSELRVVLTGRSEIRMSVYCAHSTTVNTLPRQARFPSKRNRLRLAGFHPNARNASDCVWMETGLYVSCIAVTRERDTTGSLLYTGCGHGWRVIKHRLQYSLSL